MPLVFVQRYSVGLATGTGIQTVTGQLTIGNPTVIEFDSSLWSSAQKGVPYVIFTYGTLSGSASNLTADSASLSALGFASASFADSGAPSNQITVTFS